jgi:hypothetical protein
LFRLFVSAISASSGVTVIVSDSSFGLGGVAPVVCDFEAVLRLRSASAFAAAAALVVFSTTTGDETEYKPDKCGEPIGAIQSRVLLIVRPLFEITVRACVTAWLYWLA